MQIADTTTPTLIDIFPKVSPLATSDNFGDALATASGPPGADPPPPPDVKPMDRELKTKEPNAQSDKPDPLQKKKEEDPKPDASLLPSVEAATLALSSANPKLDAVDAKVGKGVDAAKPEPNPKAEPTAATGVVSLITLPKVPNIPIVTAKAAVVPNQEPALGQGLKPDAVPQQPSAPVSAQVPTPTTIGQTKLEDGLDLKQVSPKLGPKTGEPLTISDPLALDTATLGGQTGGGTQQNAGQFGQPQPQAMLQAQAIGEVGAIDIAGQISSAALRDAVKIAADHLSELALKRSVEQVTVQLRPADLGSITLQVRNVRGHVDAKITTESEAVKQALQQNRQQLEQAVASKGMQLGKVTVGYETSDRSSNRQPRPQHPSPSQPQVSPRATPDQASRKAILAGRKTSGVDLWI